MPIEPKAKEQQRVLLFADPEGAVCAWRALFEQYGSVHQVESISDARAALEAEHFDVALVASAELLPLTSNAGRDQARLILDGISHAVCSVDRSAQLVWSNAAFRQYPPDVADRLRAACFEILQQFERDDSLRTRRRALELDTAYYFDISATALPAPGPEINRVVALVFDTTAMSRMRQKLDAIESAGRELVTLDSDVTARMEVSERLARLEDMVIRYCRDLLQFTHFAVFVLDPGTKRMDAVLSGGFGEPEKVYTIYAEPEGNGISGWVASTGQSYLCPDISQDPLYLSGFQKARSSLTVPLRLKDQIVGVLNVESDKLAAFTDEDRLFAEIFSHYLAVALQTLKLLVVERSETTGQLAAEVRAELAEPLNEIVSEATSVLQRVAEQNAEAAARLRRIIEQVDRAREVLQQVTEVQGIRGLMPPTAEIDPAFRSKRVLVADDEDIIREAIADVMSKAGALPVMARDGQEAVAMIAQQRFDLVLSDIKMPLRNGYEVFAAAKAQNPHCPVILITGFGYDPDHSIVKASREGLAGVLFKPFKVDQLMELVTKALTAPTA